MKDGSNLKDRRDGVSRKMEDLEMTEKRWGM